MKKKFYYIVTAHGYKLWFTDKHLADAYAATDSNCTYITRDASLIPRSRQEIADEYVRRDKGIVWMMIADIKKATAAV